MRIVIVFLALATFLGGCRPRSSRSSRTKQPQQQAQQPSVKITARDVMAKTDSVIERVGAMAADDMELPPFAGLSETPTNRTPWGASYVPQPDLSEYNSYEAALAAYNSAQYDKAIGLLSQIAVSGRPAELVPNSYYWMGESYYAMQRYQESLPYFEYVVKVGPQQKREIALYKLARANKSLGNDQAASLWMSRLRADYPRSQFIAQLRKAGVST